MDLMEESLFTCDFCYFLSGFKSVLQGIVYCSVYYEFIVECVAKDTMDIDPWYSRIRQNKCLEMLHQLTSATGFSNISGKPLGCTGRAAEDKANASLCRAESHCGRAEGNTS